MKIAILILIILWIWIIYEWSNAKDISNDDQKKKNKK